MLKQTTTGGVLKVTKNTCNDCSTGFVTIQTISLIEPFAEYIASPLAYIRNTYT